MDRRGEEYKKGTALPNKWPAPPENLCGKKPKWNPNGYWEGKGKKKMSWDDRSHGAGVDHGKGPQGGHWDDGSGSGGRWDKFDQPLRMSPIPDSETGCDCGSGGVPFVSIMGLLYGLSHGGKNINYGPYVY